MSKTISTLFSNIPTRNEWSFSEDKGRTRYITHGYYTYPAKFIPQLVSKLIRENSKENDIIIDPFMGSGTSIIEAIVNNRIGIGVDINEMAVLLTRVKSTPVEYRKLCHTYSELIGVLCSKFTDKDFRNPTRDIENQAYFHKRINYWFKPHIRDKLAVILHHVLKIEHSNIRDFFLIAFAQILKSCAIWLQKSIKPVRDFKKKEIDPLYRFKSQIQKMMKSHNEFNKILSRKVIDNIELFRKIENSDARNLPCEDEIASLITTSPPYVTSYEYADLHQLPLLWFGFLKELSTFRKKFIGSSFRKRDRFNLRSRTAIDIISQLGNDKKGKELENYFSDMLECFIEMRRVLKTGGRAAIVIGNTQFKGIKILNAEIFREQLESIGFKTCDIIHREISSKMLPSLRDPKNGRFTKIKHKEGIPIYSTEYILVMEKE